MAVPRHRVLPRSNTQYDREKRKQATNKNLTVLAFLLPGMIVFILFLVIPVSQSFYFSMYEWDGFGPPTDFVGIGNYETLWNHNVFRMSFSHSISIVVMSLLLQLPLALGLALLVGRGKLPGRNLFRMAFFIPYVFSEIVTAIIWQYVYHPTSGLVNVAFSAIIPGYEYQTWLGNRETALIAVFFVMTWKYFGLHMILYMAGLQGVPKDLEEAARIDGASETEVLRFVTLPMMGSTLRMTVYLSVLGSFQQFVLVWTLTKGGPVNSTELLVTYLYKYGITRFKLGYGSAIAVVLFLVTLAFSLGYQRLVMKQDYGEIG
ncbi:MAG: sugar ABC transporter permease [Anaerolineae bacterium]|nr:sugar ABC transporter permease [Anaerolineae bacterium]